jgi:hypothetical protein
MMYEDNGMSFDYKKGAWMGTAMAWDAARHRPTISLAPGSQMLPALSRAIDVRRAPDAGAKRLTFTGARVELPL